MRERVAAPVDMPVVELTGKRALDRVAHVLEGAAEERIGLAKLAERRRERTKQHGVDILPVSLAAHDQVGGALHRSIAARRLPDVPLVVLVHGRLETLHDVPADARVERIARFVDEALRLHLAELQLLRRIHRCVASGRGVRRRNARDLRRPSGHPVYSSSPRES